MDLEKVLIAITRH